MAWGWGLMKKLSCRETFKKWAEAKCKGATVTTYPIGPVGGGIFCELFTGLLDHSFLVDCACVWGGDDFPDSEFAVISRTYCSDEDIDNPPDGLKIVRLPKKVRGVNDCGVAIATIVIGKSEAANAIVTSCAQTLPACLIPYIMSSNMNENGSYIHLHANGTIHTKAEIVEVWE